MGSLTVAATFLVVLILFSVGAQSTTITARNNCGGAGVLEFTNTPADGRSLGPGQSISQSVPSGWSGRVSLNPNPRPSTLAEFTITGQNNKNTMDISLVDGYNVGLGIAYTGGGCVRNGQPASNNVVCRISVDQCPGNRQGDKCVNPNRDAQTAYSQGVKRICPDAYSWSKDDPTSTFTCNVGGDYTVTFCP